MKLTKEFELFSNRPEYDKILNLFANMSEQSLSCVETMINRFEKFIKRIKKCENFEEELVKVGISLEFLDTPNKHLKLQFSAPRKGYNLTITPLDSQNLKEFLETKPELRKSLNLATLYETYSAWGKEYYFEFDLVSSLEGPYLSLKLTEMNCETFLTEMIDVVNKKISKEDLEDLVKQTSVKGTDV